MPLVRESHQVRFRGWFLNDEDLLTDFHLGGGHRNIDYPFYEDVMHPDVLDLVLETALRMEINLVIPSSFVDILNPDEEALVRATVRRGLYISQHHVEPVGVLRYVGKKILAGKEYNVDDEHFASVLHQSLPKWEQLNSRMRSVEKTLPEPYRSYFRKFLELETFYMMQLTRWYLCCYRITHTKQEAERAEAGQIALSALDSILQARTVLEAGTWKNWHRGDRKINIAELINLTQSTLKILEKEGRI